MTLAARFAAAVDEIFEGAPPSRIGLAVSGGGDSMALLRLARDWAPGRVALAVATVDHGLRPEAPGEAEMVARTASALGLSHTILPWRGWDGRGNLQDAARTARRRLLAAWGNAAGVDAILTGHTMDDQAETVLLRLARGSGVDGLAGMAARSGRTPIWGRPLLGMRRLELRDWLTAGGHAWIDDPTNEDPAFDRVRARRVLAEPGGIGLTTERLATTAAHMRRARLVLDDAAEDLRRRAIRQQAGDLLIDRAAFAAAPADTRTRLLAAALRWVSGAAYRPRFAPLEHLAERGSGVLHGCRLTTCGRDVRITREFAAVRHLVAGAGVPWDGRWVLEGTGAPDAEVRALGPDGLLLCPGWRAEGLPAASLHATPALWRRSELLSAPLAGFGRNWRARLVDGRDVFSICEIAR
jgi:tRNA(Ile)-lysidine synthase